MCDRKIIFEDGQSFLGTGFGANIDAVSEVVFNTSMVGYQEILSDPSYFGQMVCMTYPLIGNYGLTDDDYETLRPFIGGFIVRQYNDHPSGYNYTKTLDESLKEHKIPGISGVDTRQIIKVIRSKNNIRALLTFREVTAEEGVRIINSTKKLKNHVEKVSCTKFWHSRCANFKYTVVVIDCGVKHNVIRSLKKRGCNVIIVPYKTSAKQILELQPDGVLVSNGPGDPCDNQYVMETIKLIQGVVPIFGICLGHQLIALANGAKTYRMKFGHRGANHPVKEVLTGKIEITAQNHSYAVEKASLSGTDIRLTHENILDGAVEGIEIEKKDVFSVQYHPESAPGPQDSSYLFDRFITKMQKRKRQNVGPSLF
ncbi:MAG: glutamine-hydrolyzing carbamoyl-phosphate synthase small subunit [Oscillospiraceae bacterium]|jgi:carbamoyl-phosphate synthase small subunit|nr:glutamine-hydrolyzing carbamoyl-phosphate synthase small subunit [Oscillospiraceae bacterium]